MRGIAVFGFLCAFCGAASACDAGKAGFAVGEPFSAELAESARVAAEATAVRRLIKGFAYTMEFVDSRLNLHTDESGRVWKVACG